MGKPFPFLLILSLFLLPLSAYGGHYQVKVVEGLMEKRPHLPSPSWRDVLQEALERAVKEVTREMAQGWEEVLEEGIGGRAADFVMSYRILQRVDSPWARRMVVEVTVDREALREALQALGLVKEERAKDYSLVLVGIRKYEDLMKLERELQKGEKVQDIQLQQAERGRFVFRVTFSGPKGELERVLSSLKINGSSLKVKGRLGKVIEAEFYEEVTR